LLEALNIQNDEDSISEDNEVPVKIEELTKRESSNPSRQMYSPRRKSTMKKIVMSKKRTDMNVTELLRHETGKFDDEEVSQINILNQSLSHRLYE
jgi:hypothetical protein